ncbi:hypothetical protein ACWCPS_33010 [Streptomyces mauvecolor]
MTDEPDVTFAIEPAPAAAPQNVKVGEDEMQLVLDRACARKRAELIELMAQPRRQWSTTPARAWQLRI